MPAATLFTLPAGLSHICTDTALSFSAPILPVLSHLDYLRCILAIACLQDLRRLQGNPGLELRSIFGGTARLANTSSIPP